VQPQLSDHRELKERQLMQRKLRSHLKTTSRRKAIPPSPRSVLSSDFWRAKTVEELASEQGVKPVENPNDLLGDFWPEDESIDDFLRWHRQLRREQKGID